ncbi:hypothetical protein IAT40_006048 [Kwoniella sp. CBS 6097]
MIIADDIASLQYNTEQLRLWLDDRIAQSRKMLKGRINEQTLIDAQGKPREAKIAPATLHHYKSVAQRLLLYSKPPLSPSKLYERRIELAKATSDLIKDHKLARHSMPPEVMGPSEVRILLEYFLEDGAFSTDADVQNSLLNLTLLFAGIRVSTALSTSAYPDTHLDWQDVSIGPDRDDDGTIVGIVVRILFRHWKGYRYKSRFILKYRIPAIQKRPNVVFDLGLLFFAHAYRNGVFKDSDKPFESFFGDEFSGGTWEFKEEYLTKPVFWRGTPKGTGLDQQAPLSSDGFQRVMKRVLEETGLRGPNDETVTLYAFRRDFLTRMAKRHGSDVAAKLAGHEGGPRILNKHYRQDHQEVSLNEGLNIGEKAETPEKLFERRQVAFCMTRSANQMRLTSVVGKTRLLSPTTAKSGAYGSAETASLLAAYRKLSRRRRDHLRREERAGKLKGAVVGQSKPDFRQRKERQRSDQAESTLTRDIDLKLLEDARKEMERVRLRSTADDEAEVVDISVEEDAIDEDLDEALQGEDAADDQKDNIAGAQEGELEASATSPKLDLWRVTRVYLHCIHYELKAED